MRPRVRVGWALQLASCTTLNGTGKVSTTVVLQSWATLTSERLTRELVLVERSFGLGLQVGVLPLTGSSCKGRLLSRLGQVWSAGNS